MIMSILFLLIVAASDSVGTISWLSVFIANNDSDPFAISQMAIGTVSYTHLDVYKRQL